MFPKSIAELFGKEEKPTDKQKRQVTTCLFAKMSSFDDGAGNEIRTRDIRLGKATLYH